MGRTTTTQLFEERAISPQQIAQDLKRIGDSTTDEDCRLRNYLLEILQLRRELADEQAIVNALEQFGLQTLGSIYGVHSVSGPPSYKREWVCWQGRKHTGLRSAVREAIEIRKGKKKASA
jgi:hypothetical protein